MKIAYVTSRYPVLTETFVAREIQEVVDLGHDVLACQLRPAWNYREATAMRSDSVRIVKWNWNVFSMLWANLCALAGRPGPYLDCVRDMVRAFGRISRIGHVVYILLVSAWIARTLSREKIDHIHCHFLRTEAVGGMWIARLMGKRFSVTEHTKFLYPARSLSLRAINDAAFLVADIGEVREMLNELSGEKGCPIHFVRNGIKLGDLPLRTPGGPHDNPPPTLLAIGRLCDYKGFDILIQACARLEQKGIPFRCRIIGEGPERPLLEKLRADLQLDEKVDLPGEVTFSELRTEYDRAAVLVVPSRGTEFTDGLPTVAIEALAMGIPTVATRWAGIPDLIIDGETGLLAEPNSIPSLAEKVGEMLTKKEQWSGFASRGRKIIEDEYDLSANVKRLVAHWEEAVKECVHR